MASGSLPQAVQQLEDDILPLETLDEFLDVTGACATPPEKKRWARACALIMLTLTLPMPRAKPSGVAEPPGTLEDVLAHEGSADALVESITAALALVE